jgi:dipeptidyl aminopeptidase/acylaminoacyl peptidase
MSRIFIQRILALTLLTCSVSHAQKQTLTAEMVVSLKSVTAAAIDPSGQNAAYILATPRGADDETGPRFSELFVISTQGGTAKQYTYRPYSVESPQWSSDGRWIYFISRRKDINERRQVYRIAAGGGEAQLMSNSRTDVRLFKISSDGQRVAYTATDGTSESEKQNTKKGMDVRTVDKQFKPHRLYIQSLENAESACVSGELSVWNFDWSPDGNQIVFAASPTPRMDDSYMFKKIYVVSRTAQTPAKILTETSGKLGALAWSPDGKSIAFLGGVDETDPSVGNIFVVSAAGGAAKNLTERFEGTVLWTEWMDNATLAFSAVERSHTTLNTVPAAGGAVKRWIESGYNFTTTSMSADGKKYVMTAGTTEHASELFTGAFAQKQLTRLTRSNPGLENIRFAGSKEISWKAKDGLEISGLLMLPLDYQAGKKYPCIVQAHGGPESADVEGWTTNYVRWSELLAARGYVVFSPNYRGSTGRGVAFGKADHKDLGNKEFQDVLDGLDTLAKQGMIDPQRVGMGGFSYGGYFSALAATRYSEHFKAVSVGAGITDWLSFVGTTEIPRENSMVHWNLEVYKNMKTVWEGSPLAYVEKCQTAVLISQGEKDERVPPNQAWELYTALTLLGKTVDLDIYPREEHGFSERNHQLHFIKRNLDWFDKYVKGEKAN